jgi:hypothetical protein
MSNVRGGFAWVVISFSTGIIVSELLQNSNMVFPRFAFNASANSLRKRYLSWPSDVE